MLELRVHPERLTAEINQLLDKAWNAQDVAGRKAG
jgi:hypothetical protein